MVNRRLTLLKLPSIIKWKSHKILGNYLGNQYKAHEIQFGAIRNDFFIRQSLPPQLPVNVILIFEDVSQQARSVSIRLECNNGGFFPVLRNIPLTK